MNSFTCGRPGSAWQPDVLTSAYGAEGSDHESESRGMWMPPTQGSALPPMLPAGSTEILTSDDGQAEPLDVMI